MKDGLYIVRYGGIMAGFVLKDGMTVACAPVLRRKLPFFKSIAVWWCE